MSESTEKKNIQEPGQETQAPMESTQTPDPVQEDKIPLDPVNTDQQVKQEEPNVDPLHTTETTNEKIDAKETINDVKESMAAMTQAVASNSTVQEIWRLIKTWFSRSPLNVYQKPIDTTTTWSLFGIYLLIATVGVLLGSRQQTPIYHIYLGGFQLLFSVLLSHASFYGLFAVAIFLIAKSNGCRKASLINSFSMVLISMIPMTVVSLIISIIMPIFPLIGLAILPVLIMLPINLYQGAQIYLGTPQTSPYWSFAIALTIALLLAGIIGISVVGSALWSQLRYFF